MIGLLYLILCFTVGWVICTYAFPGLSQIVEKDYEKRKISISPYLLLLPSWFVTGTLAVTWPTYLIAYVFGNKAEPLFYANIIVMPIAVLVSVGVMYLRFRKAKAVQPVLLCKDRNAVAEFVLLAAIAALGIVLMWTTFFIQGDKLYIGVSVFSDFSPHIGMIRSFSYGNNFPTTYSHYAGEDIRYHFMFQFLAGNLEYLGLRLDYAFNLPSIISFISAFLMLYVLAVKITGKIGAGILACLFFAFRSAKTLFTYLSNLPEGTNIFKSLADNTDFISDTPHEDWGLWNLNVYCNQRHLAFGLTVFLFVIILMTPHLYEMFESLKQYRLNKSEHNKKNHKSALQKFGDRMKIIFFTADAWMYLDLRRAIATGILLGSMAFFHGAAVIGCLSVLFVMAVMSKRRTEFIIVAFITLFLSSLQTHLFIKGSAIAPQLFFGFIAENKTIYGVASYLERLLGILPFVLLAALCIEKLVGKYLIAAFTAPLIFAFTVSLTVDVTVNHKYIMMSCMLLGIFAAALIMKLFERKELLPGLVGSLLVIMLTATGIYDFTTVLKKNTPESSIVLTLDDPLTDWINKNSDSKDIFLTSNYTVNQVVLGGAMLYEGWPYYPWSAGYDTETRSEKVKEMYEAASPQKLDSLVQANKIRFIIVDKSNRDSEDYIVNEANIKATYACVYTNGEGDWLTSIYDTSQPIYK
ncbi:MAG TPA: hypothetical protein VN258_12905 [Mobilitalea sp.]|nr:hypothetical protein [Mobilitalea sp.]